MTNVTDFDPENSVRAARGITNPEVASNTILIRDLFGGEVEAAVATLSGGIVTEGDDHEAIIELDSGVKWLLNNGDIDLELGDIVIVDTSTDEAVVPTTDAAVSAKFAGVAQAAIQAGARGPIRFFGYTPAIKLTGIGVRGQWVQTSTTATEGDPVADRGEGTFAQLLTGADPADITPEGDPVVDSKVTLLSVAGTSMTIDMPDTRPDGIGYFLALWRGVATTPTITGWTRIGSTSGFYFYTRAGSSEPATYSATWSSSSLAVAAVLALDPNVDPSAIVHAFAYDATSSPAALSGMTDAYYLVLAAVGAFAPNKDGWEAIASASLSGSGTTGSLIDRNHSQGTDTLDPYSTWPAIKGHDPTLVNDASDATSGYWDALAAGPTDKRGFYADLGTPCEIHSIRLKTVDTRSGTYDQFYYSTDGVSWSGGASSGLGTWSGSGTDETLTLTSPITARYWRSDRLAVSGFNAVYRCYSWELIGYQVTQDVAGSLVARYVKGTGVTSPFSGTDEAADGIFALSLLADPFVSAPKPSALIKDPDLTAAGGFSGNIEDLPTSETDTGTRLAPNGTGGVAWVAEVTPGGFLTATDGEGQAVDTNPASGAAATIDCSLANIFDITLTANCTLTIANAPAAGVGGIITIILRQGGTGSYTVTWPAAVTWPDTDGTTGGAAPTLWTAVGAQDDIELSTLDGGVTWGGTFFAHPITGATYATPAIVLGTAAANGAASTGIRSDATIVAFDTTAPADVAAVGVASSAGSVAYAARRDHGHALTYHDEPLTDGASNFIFDGGDIIVVTGVPNA